MTPDTSNDNNECQVLCSICGGECCRTKPGIDSPERFLAAADPVGALFEVLSSGLWVLDRHYGTPPRGETAGLPGTTENLIRYPRPATTAERDAGSLTAVAGACECVFLAEDGCLLPFDERPRMCRALEPEINFECSSSWTRGDAALAWLPWQGIVAAVLDRLARTP